MAIGNVDGREELVEASYACPRCGERRADWLVWVNDEQVECVTCKNVFEP